MEQFNEHVDNDKKILLGESTKVKHIVYNKLLKDAFGQLPKGAFLTVKKNDVVNTMTISWGTVGVMWGKSVMVIGVRPSRFTYQFLDLGSAFTVSIPLTQKLKSQLAFVGSHSGKEYDKIAQTQLTLKDGQQVNVPIIHDCELHFECVVVAKHQLIPEYIDSVIRERHYPEGDLHMMFYGEIVDSYKISEDEVE